MLMAHVKLRFEGYEQTNYNSKQGNHLNQSGNDQHLGLNFSWSFRLSGHGLHGRTSDTADSNTSPNGSLYDAVIFVTSSDDSARERLLIGLEQMKESGIINQ